MNNPWRVCLRIGKKDDSDIVASNVHYQSQKQADGVRQALLSSEAIKSQPQGEIGVLVMHYKTFQKCCSEGTGVTISRLEQNAQRYGEAFALHSPTYMHLDLIQRLLTKEFKK